ncbi:uncharacterized protein B0H64DRAFT_419477 [Chaetomium fimeti]|uniref:Zn(2)-C6 fungal-type domain-containing protein n=1 Tax=Chaetomium fimeti TaxID=1854472 RepID=A0AAE0H9C1_9PEZI|nr:hypothetical protein B0H64DRAFT_419477 [Chaetomium fimeti]
MSIPETYKAFRRTTGDLPRTITPSTEQLPRELGPHDVLLKIHAVSLNFRDVGMLNGRYPIDVIERGIPCSDAAAEVAAMGSAVKDFAIGDHVSVMFDLSNLTGFDDEPGRALGGDVDGVLGEYAIFEEKNIVQLPKHLSWEEGATIACAGVTAWTALDGLKAANPRSALLQGTGGVSLFALLICLAAGIQPIITSSSDKKLEDIQKLGADVRGLNYRTVSDQASEVKRLTDGKGVDFVVNNTGPASLPEDISFLRQRGGLVSLVGFLAGTDGDWKPSVIMGLMAKFATLKGVAVGSKEDFVDLNRFLEEKKVSLAPLVDRVFTFDESPAAFDYLYSGSHVGKVIIKNIPVPGLAACSPTISVERAETTRDSAWETGMRNRRLFLYPRCHSRDCLCTDYRRHPTRERHMEKLQHQGLGPMASSDLNLCAPADYPSVTFLEWEGDQPYTASSGNYSSGTQYEVSPVERHGTPGAFFPGSSQLSESDYRATPPPVAPMRATDTKGIGRGGRGGKPASSASPATGKSKRVRTGCLTCRERHLKCDEGVPECNNCRKSNRECRRGIRLNFIDIQVKDPPYLPPTTEWSVQILDESRLIAAEYRGGLGRYPEVVSSTPEPDLDASRREPERSDAQTVSHFLSATSGGGDTSVIRDQYHPQHVGQPPPRGPPSHHGSPPARPGLESSSLDARSAPRPQLGPGGFGEDAFSFASLHDPDGVKGLKSHTLNIRNRDGLTIGPPNEFRSAAQASSSRQIGTPTGLMTPSSENTTGERDYLSTAEEIHFMQVFIDEVSIWMDALNKDKHFANTVPYLALKLPMLLNALLACGARHLTLTGQHSGEKADYYYNMATTQLLSQQTRDRNSSENALTAVVLTAYNVMTDRPNDRMGHIASTRALIRECGWNASSTGLAVACFWVNVGMEVLSCISFGWQTAWDPDQWGLDLEFATLGAASRSGSRSVAGSDDVWSVRAEGHPVANDSLETADEEELYLHRIFYIMAKVANFRANTPQFQEPSPHDEQVRLQNRFAEWRRLQNMCNAWNLNCPRSMRPYGYLPEPSSKSLFPNVW